MPKQSQLRADVFKGRNSQFWFVSVSDPRNPHRSLRLRIYRSWPEAMVWARKHLAELDKRLMTEVHESSSSRRSLQAVAA